MPNSHQLSYNHSIVQGSPSSSLNSQQFNRNRYGVSCFCEAHDKKPRIYTGTNSFAELVTKSDLFVDKSTFIQDFLEDGDKVALITRPRRWGKSLNMDMLKCFLAIEVDQAGKPLPLEQAPNHKLFASGEIALAFGETKKIHPLEISKNARLMKYQGQYPVISLGLKDVKGSSYEDIEDAVETEIITLYNEYKYLKQHGQDETTLLEDNEKEKLKVILKV